MKQTLIYALLLLFPFLGNSQETSLKPIGSWTEYLPFQSGSSIDLSSNSVYTGTTTGLFTVNLGDRSLTRYSTVNRLNEIRIDELAFSSYNNTLIVVYENLNIDLLKGSQTVNIPSIKEASIANKSINGIFLKNNFAYLSMGFGIVKLDVDRNEISETYQFGPGGTAINVNATFVDDSKIYAATNSGIYKADLSSNLLDFNSWSLYSTNGKTKFIDIFGFNNEILTIFDEGSIDSVFALVNNGLEAKLTLSGNDIIDRSLWSDRLLLATSEHVRIYDNQYQQITEIRPFLANLTDIAFNGNRIYLLNNFDPLLEFDYSGNVINNIRPQGPFEENIFDLDVKDGILWAVPGGYNQSINNLNRPGRVYRYEDGKWTNFIDFNFPSLNGSYDILTVKSNPANPNEVYMGCWGFGLIKYENNVPFVVYDEDNSILKDRLARPDWVAIGETEFDADGNIWIVNSYTPQLLSVISSGGTWYPFDFSKIIPPFQDDQLNEGDEPAATDIEITESGIIYVALDFDNHVLVFDHNNTLSNTSDDKFAILKQGVGQGDVPGIRGITMDIDLENQLWIGTSDGIAVQYNPDNILDRSRSDRDFERVLIDDGENVEILLGGTEIADIETDGANRKWVATNGSGLYLLSADGKEEISHFTTENSPLFSDNILAVAIDDKSGEVYISTANGLLSYRSDVVEGAENLSNIKVFPNPVREDYRGPIAIDGLMNETRVKITDIEGRLVNEIESKGGRAIWNGNDFNGNRVSTGVYLIFGSAVDEKDNLKTAIGKILFIR